MCFSVLVSTELVASSRIRIGALDTAALAIFKKLPLALAQVRAVALQNRVIALEEAA